MVRFYIELLEADPHFSFLADWGSKRVSDLSEILNSVSPLPCFSWSSLYMLLQKLGQDILLSPRREKWARGNHSEKSKLS